MILVPFNVSRSCRSSGRSAGAFFSTKASEAALWLASRMRKTAGCAELFCVWSLRIATAPLFKKFVLLLCEPSVSLKFVAPR